MNFQERNIGKGKEGIIEIGLLNKEIRDIEGDIFEFTNRHIGEFYEVENEIKMLFGYNIGKEVLVDLNIEIQYEIEITRAIPTAKILYYSITPESLLFKNMQKSVYTTTFQLRYLKNYGDMLIIDNGISDRIGIYKKSIQETRVDRNYLYKFVNHHAGALGIIYFTVPLSLKTLISKWKMLTWNNNANKNYAKGDTLVKSYEYRKITNEELKDILRKSINRAYKQLFAEFMDGKDTRMTEEGVCIWEKLGRIYHVGDIDRKEDVKSGNILYSRYLELVEKLKGENCGNQQDNTGEETQ